MNAAGFVYAVSCGDLVKIGFSRKPSLRLVKIKTDAGGPCALLGLVAATMAQEKELHGLLAPQRAFGEWFRKEGPVIHFLSILPAPPAAMIGRKKIENSDAHPLRAYRARENIGVNELAKRLGVQRLSIWRWENRRQGIARHPWPRFQKITGIPIEQLAVIGKPAA